MNLIRRKVYFLWVALAVVVSSLLFQNCTSKLNSQFRNTESQLASKTEPTTSEPVEFVRVVQLKQKPRPISNKTEDIVEVEVLPELAEHVDQLEYRMSVNSDWIEFGGSMILLNGLSEGVQSLYVRARSKDNRVSEVEDYTWFVDSAKPVISLLGLIEDLPQEKNVEIGFTVQDVSSFDLSCRLNGIVIPECQSPIEIKNMRFGSEHAVEIEALDAAGNVSDKIQFELTALFLEPSWQSLNTMIFSRRCTGCHNSQTLSGGFDLTKYSTAVTRVVPGNASTSPIFQRVSGIPSTAQRMPLGMASLSVREIETIAAWINLGALND